MKLVLNILSGEIQIFESISSWERDKKSVNNSVIVYDELKLPIAYISNVESIEEL